MKKFIIVLAIGLLVLVGIALIASMLFSFEFDFPLISQGIAVIPIKGEIVLDSSSFSAQMSALEIVDALQRAEKDPSIGAIMLEINSPGGSVVATRQIVDGIRKAGEHKKVVSWVSETGASGAYYIAAASDYVVADADSITGGIGVIGIFPNVEGLLEKLGIEVKVVKEGEHKDIGSIFSGLSKEDEKIIQRIFHSAFARFREDILLFRGDKIDAQKFEEIADGRILSGEQALGIGLVDELGTRTHAIEITADLAGIAEPREVYFGKAEPSLLELFSSAGYRFGLGFKQGLLKVESAVKS
jgi:protease-4